MYGEIPKVLNVSHSFSVTTKGRKYYIAIDKGGQQKRYTQLKDLPITRDELWFVFNHGIPDHNQTTWNIVPAEKGEIKTQRNPKTKHIVCKDSNDEIIKIFISQKDCLKFLGIKGCSALLKAIANHSLYHGYFWEVSSDE